MVLLRRIDHEQRERDMLAPYAQFSADSRGRRYPERADDLRTCFQRDRDRIIHSSAYRRLGNKTQVFVTFEGDYYRTRLTHTEEGTQIALTIARALGLNMELTEAISRAHDLGHAPFGHAGEAALAVCMRDFGGFEHNWQTLRIVDELECEYPDHPGLNLSWEVREGIAKHEAESSLPALDEFRNGVHHSLEAQVADLSDEIAYGCHDLDDGIAAGLIPWRALHDEQPVWWADAVQSIEQMYGGRPEPDFLRRRVKHYLVNRLTADLIETSAEELALTAPSSSLAARQHPDWLIRFSPRTRALRDDMHGFLMRHMYQHYEVMTMWQKADRLITAVFGALCAEPRQLPPHVHMRLRAGTPIERVVADYIAEMSDRKAVREYHRLYDYDVQVLP